MKSPLIFMCLSVADSESLSPHGQVRDDVKMSDEHRVWHRGCVALAKASSVQLQKARLVSAIRRRDIRYTA